MNFKALVSGYDSSESESDEETPIYEAACVDSARRTAKGNKDLPSNANEGEYVPKESVEQSAPKSAISGNTGSISVPPPPPPPPPTALLGGSQPVQKDIGVPRRSEVFSESASKRRKIEDQDKTVRDGLVLPRQVQMQVPNVSTEDLQSYGMKSFLKKKPR